MFRGYQADTVYVHTLGERTIALSGLPPEAMVALLREHLPHRVVLDPAPPPPHTRNDFVLSDRERDIVRLITLGESNQDIADLLFLSHNTVKTYIRTAYRKMGVSRRSQAVLWGIRHGLDAAVPPHWSTEEVG